MSRGNAVSSHFGRRLPRAKSLRFAIPSRSQTIHRSPQTIHCTVATLFLAFIIRILRALLASTFWNGHDQSHPTGRSISASSTSFSIPHQPSASHSPAPTPWLPRQRKHPARPACARRQRHPPRDCAHRLLHSCQLPMGRLLLEITPGFTRPRARGTARYLTCRRLLLPRPLRTSIRCCSLPPSFPLPRPTPRLMERK